MLLFCNTHRINKMIDILSETASKLIKLQNQPISAYLDLFFCNFSFCFISDMAFIEPKSTLAVTCTLRGALHSLPPNRMFLVDDVWLLVAPSATLLPVEALLTTPVMQELLRHLALVPLLFTSPEHPSGILTQFYTSLWSSRLEKRFCNIANR